MVTLDPGKDNCLGLLPFFHIYGLVVVQFGCLQTGTRLITVPQFEPEMFLKAIQQEKVLLKLYSVFTS